MREPSSKMFVLVQIPAYMPRLNVEHFHGHMRKTSYEFDSNGQRYWNLDSFPISNFHLWHSKLQLIVITFLWYAKSHNDNITLKHSPTSLRLTCVAIWHILLRCYQCLMIHMLLWLLKAYNCNFIYNICWRCKSTINKKKLKPLIPTK